MAEDEVSKVVTHNHKEYIPHDIFCEFFANFAFKYVENVDIKSLRSFFDMIYERITKIMFYDLKGNIIFY